MMMMDFFGVLLLRPKLTVREQRSQRPKQEVFADKKVYSSSSRVRRLEMRLRSVSLSKDPGCIGRIRVWRNDMYLCVLIQES